MSDAPRICDFCGRFEPLTIEAKDTARVICSSCVWLAADALSKRNADAAALTRAFEHADRSGT